MIGMGGSACSYNPGEISGGHGIGRGPADTYHGFNTINNLTGSHITVLATGAAGTKETGRHASTLNAVIGSTNLFCQILTQ
jgi:hypothetical protein